MPQNDPLNDTLSRRRSAHAQQRALRKELLLLRSEVQRAEFVGAVNEVRDTVTGFAWLKMFVPGVSAGRLLKSTKHFNAGLAALLDQYPLLISAASMVLGKPLRHVFGGALKPALKWGGLAFAAWKSREVLKQMLRELGRKRDKSD